MLFGYLFGQFGQIKIGLGDLTEPTASSYSQGARISSLDPLYGPEIDQDRGTKRATRSLSFHFDNAFCDVDRELYKLKHAMQKKQPIHLQYGHDYDSSAYIITNITITEQRLDGRGIVACAQIDIALRETVSQSDFGAVFDFISPLILRG